MSVVYLNVVRLLNIGIFLSENIGAQLVNNKIEDFLVFNLAKAQRNQEITSWGHLRMSSSSYWPRW